MCIEQLKQYFEKDQIGKPKYTKKIGDLQIEDLIIMNLGYKPVIKTFDSWYKTTKFLEYDRFIDNDKTNWNKYQPEYTDCDDFAIALWGSFSKNPNWSSLAFGVVCADFNNGKNAHAFNIFITNDHSVFYCEPQNDKIWLMSADKKYKPYFIMF